MQAFEYKVVPAPRKGLKGKGIKGGEARFANALQVLMNRMGAEGWEYQRADALPVEERQGLTGKTTSFQHMLVFRRPLARTAADEAPAALIEDQSTKAATPAPAAPSADERVTLTLGPETRRDAAPLAPNAPEPPKAEDSKLAAE